jgi:SAM-dependent methyltransferase
MDNPGPRAPPIDTTAFYDWLAAGYHLIYGDRWDAAVARQGEALQRLIAALVPDARDVLDCPCGIGTQAIGLALHGCRVTGTDVSEVSLARGAREARRLGAELVALARADFRALDGYAGSADVVLSADNAVPHLLTDSDLDAALRAMHGALRPGGLLVLSTRDYDAALRERPPAAPPLELAGPPRRVVIRTQEWDAPDSPLHTVRFLFPVRGRRRPGMDVRGAPGPPPALPSDALAAAPARAGFSEIAWHPAERVGFHQTAMTARRAAVG